MNEFVAKKLGEVLAFSRIGIECAERSGSYFTEAIGEHGAHFSETLATIATVVEQIGNDITRSKAEATVLKLRGMMEAYIGDEWQNPTEILEWLSFFAGAAGAHWSLVKGAADTLHDDKLQDVADDAIKGYEKLLVVVNEQLYAVGQQRSV